MQVLCETVATAGGNLNASSKVFKDSLFNKTTWSLTAGIFIAELGLLSYQRFVANDKIDDQTYKRRVMASFFSNAVGVLGGSSGAFIGCFIGNLITPGIGGYIGSLIGGFLTSAAASLGVDYMIDSQSYTLAEYEAAEVSDHEKEKSYLLACDII